MITAVRRIQFCAGHRVRNHEGKCRHLHGHNYVVYLHASAEKLDPVGRVIDFAVLKDRIGGWIEQHWDHGFICQRDDDEAISAVSALSGQKIATMDNNPTAENIALHLLHEVGPSCLADVPIKLVRVEVWETENCCAEATLE